MNWRTIDKLQAQVPGAPSTATNYRGMVEFEVRFGRHGTPLSLTGADDEIFRIENKTLDIAVEGKTLTEAKEKLREQLAASDDFSGTWSLWMKVEVSGGYEPNNYRNAESAICQIEVRYVVQLITTKGGSKRARHMDIRESLPTPFVGEFWKPTTHKELSRLREGPALGKRDDFNRDEVWIEATPDLVETIRTLQRRLGASGDAVKAALSRKRFLETIDAVRSGGRLLDTSLTLETKDQTIMSTDKPINVHDAENILSERGELPMSGLTDAEMLELVNKATGENYTRIDHSDRAFANDADADTLS